MKHSVKKLLLSSLFVMMACVSCQVTDTKTKQTKIEENAIDDIQDNKAETESVNRREETSSSLLYIMPQYKEVLYSRAYFRQFIKKELATLRECYGQLADILNNEEMDKAEKSVAMKNYMQLEEFVLKAERKEIDEDKYESLKNQDYITYIKKETIFDKKQNLSKANYSLKLEPVQTYDLYYSFDCNIHRPYLISKKDVEKLKKIALEDEESATKVIELPVNKDGIVSSRDEVVSTKKIKLYYDGALGFLYYANAKQEDSALREISIKEYDDESYAFYEDEEWVIEHPEKSIKLSILKDANIGRGENFKQIALADDDYNVGDDDRKYYYNLEDLFRRIMENEDSFLSKETDFVGNYLKFDDKGYVTDFYYFGEIE